MGASVSNFFTELGQGLTTLYEETQREFIRPVLGDNISDSLGILKPRVKGMADGGMVLEGQKGVKVIDTPAQLIALIKKYPEEAKANGLSVEMVKEEVKKMARGGVMARGRGGMARGGEVMGCSHGCAGCSMAMDHGMSRPNPMMYGGMKKGGKSGLRLF
jgi:hypothetical protein